MLAVSSFIAGNVVVVGDLHGCLKQLLTLLRKVNFRSERYLSAVHNYNYQTLQSHYEEKRQALASSKSSDKRVQHEHKHRHSDYNHEDDVNEDEQSWSIASLPYKVTMYDSKAVKWDNESKTSQHTVHEDVCLFVGDLVNKGPYSFETVRFLRDIGALGVLGNHEVKLLQLIHKKEEGTLTELDKQSSLYSLAVDCPRDVREYLETLPFVLCIPQFHCVIVHAAVDPSVTLAEQQHIVLTKARNLASRHKYKKLIASHELQLTSTNKEHKQNEQVAETTQREQEKQKQQKQEENDKEVKEQKTTMKEDDKSVEEKSSGEKNKTALAVSHYFAVMEKQQVGKAWAEVWEKCFTRFLKHHRKDTKKDHHVKNAVSNLNNDNTFIDSSTDESNDEDDSLNKELHTERIICNGVKRLKKDLALCEELYSWCNNDALIIFGHDARRGLQRYEHAIGLDSGCVYGHQLSALVLPTRTVVSVQGWNEKHHKQHHHH